MEANFNRKLFFFIYAKNKINIYISFILSIYFQGILENAIKITNEPPTGMHANLHAALDNFDQVGKR